VRPAARRILAAITDHLEEADYEHRRGGTVSLVVKLDDAGCPKRISVRTELERPVERR
jgi:hypothetical protein